MKFIRAGYALTLLLILAAAAVHYLYIVKDHPTMKPWLPIASALLLLWPIKRHIQRQTVKVTIAGDKLRYEVGLFSKSTRIIQLPKVQDVRVVQSIGQRMFGVGDIAIETAGENSRLTVENLDRPQELAEQLTDLSSHPSGAGVP
ncbi:MAG TPA: PH domain-containing protein [Bryobacteraceae bacterium]